MIYLFDWDRDTMTTDGHVSMYLRKEAPSHFSWVTWPQFVWVKRNFKIAKLLV